MILTKQNCRFRFHSRCISCLADYDGCTVYLSPGTSPGTSLNPTSGSKSNELVTSSGMSGSITAASLLAKFAKDVKILNDTPGMGVSRRPGKAASISALVQDVADAAKRRWKTKFEASQEHEVPRGR
jgi:hypothetical protein